MALTPKHPARRAAQGPRLRLAVRFLFGVASVLSGEASAIEAAQSPDSLDAPKSAPAPKRGFRTFQPRPGEAIDAPSTQVVQLLLDRQDKGEFESYMVQVLFRGKPSQRSVRTLRDRVEIDFYDTGKPSMRLAKIRGGVLEASSVEEFFYKDFPGKSPPDGTPGLHAKRLVRLTLFMHEQPELKIRDTLDRTLIHFRLPKVRPDLK